MKLCLPFRHRAVNLFLQGYEKSWIETEEHYLVTAPGEWVLINEKEASEEVTPDETPVTPEDDSVVTEEENLEELSD